MPTSTMFWQGLLLCLSYDVIGVRGQPTTDLCHSDDNGDRQVALLEQTLQALNAVTGRLQSVESRLVSIEGRLNSMESRQELIEFWVKECNSKGIVAC